MILDGAAADKVVYDCRVSGHPEPTITWQYDGVDVSNSEISDRLVVESVPTAMSSDGTGGSGVATVTSQLTVHQVRVQDSGMFTCIAVNMVDGGNGARDVFRAQDTATLSVLSKCVCVYGCACVLCVCVHACICACVHMCMCKSECACVYADVYGEGSMPEVADLYSCPQTCPSWLLA